MKKSRVANRVVVYLVVAVVAPILFFKQCQTCLLYSVKHHLWIVQENITDIKVLTNLINDPLLYLKLFISCLYPFWHRIILVSNYPHHPGNTTFLWNVWLLRAFSSFEFLIIFLEVHGILFGTISWFLSTCNYYNIEKESI